MKTVRLLLVVFACLLDRRVAYGQDEPRTLAQLEHTAFTQRNGAPAQVWALAQTTDGFLWLGASAGLYRFDGVTFEHIAPPPGQSALRSNISALFALQDGSLWIGSRTGGVSRLSNGVVTSYGEREGMPPGTVFAFARDEGGVLWAGTSGGAATFDGRRWTRHGDEIGLTGAGARALLQDRAGALWVDTDSGLFRRPRGESRFVKRDTLVIKHGSAIAEAPDGTVWEGASFGTLLRLSDPTAGSSSLAPGRVTGGIPIFIDRDSAAWIVVDDGVIREKLPSGQASSSAPEHITHALGLSGSLVIAFLEDREHDIWLATDMGIDRFRATKLIATSFPWQSLFPSPVSGARDSLAGILVTTWAHSLYRIRPDGLTPFPQITSNLSVGTRASDGTVWVAGIDGLWRVTGDSATRVDAPHDAVGASVAALAVDREGTLWYSAVRRGVFRRRAGVWSRFDTGATPRPALAIVADGARVWLSYPNSVLAVVDGPTVHEYSRAQGLDIGNVLAVSPHAGHTWVGGETGIVRLAQGRFDPLIGFDHSQFRAITGVVERANGEMWLNGADGITRITAGEMRAFENNPTHRVRFERLDYHDGLLGIPFPLYPVPTAVEAGDGTMWFTTESAVMHLHPDAVLHNSVPPSVHILTLTVGDSTYRAARTISLPPRTTAITIGYTAPSLPVPERVRFRYWLTGSDTSWQDAGSRREAFYTNLGPGHYHFRLIAANDDDVWSEHEAAMDVDIQPTFAQTRWFMALCWATGAMAIYLLYLLRLRFVAARMRARFEATLAERTRIAHDLHDTLLQGFTGITLHLHGILRTLTDRPESARAGLSEVLEHADAALRDARRTVWDMHSRELESATLAESLALAAKRATAGSAIDVRFGVRGAERRLSGVLELTALRVGTEAVSNAVKHAAARTIEVDIEYGDRALTLHVRDDGRGLGHTIIDAASLSGHLGIAGMRERATRAGGTLDIASTSHSGTTLTLVLPIETP